MSQSEGNMFPWPIGDTVDSKPAPLPERIILKGRYVTLEPLCAEKHADSIYEETNQERLWLYVYEEHQQNIESFRALITRKEPLNDPLFFAIIDNSTGRAVGYQALMRIDAANRVIEVGKVLYGTSLQRTKGATEAQYLFAAYIFDVLGYRRYEWKCNNLNEPSKRAAERLGFIFEGVFRQQLIVKGRNCDTAWFSILDSEWPQRKAALEAWLDPGNFDSQGCQVKSLSSFLNSTKNKLPITDIQEPEVLNIGDLVDERKAQWPDRVTLKGRYVTLEPLSIDKHADSIYGETHETAYHLWYYMATYHCPDRESFYQRAQELSISTDRIIFAIVDNMTNRALGWIDLHNMVPEHRTVEVGSVIYSPALQRTRGATEAQYLLASYAFDVLGYRRYEWMCNTLHRVSRRAAERIGFTFETLLRQKMINKGRNHDTVYYSILDSEWPHRKAALECWLDPDNFDSQGCQIKPLSHFQNLQRKS